MGVGFRLFNDETRWARPVSAHTATLPDSCRLRDMLTRRLLPCLIVLALCSSICFGQVKLPTDIPSGQVCAAWLQAFNSGDRDTYRAFLEKYSPARLDRLDSAMDFRSRTGGLELKKIESSSPREYDIGSFVRRMRGRTWATDCMRAARF